MNLLKLHACLLCVVAVPASVLAQTPCVRWLEVPGQHITSADLVVSPGVEYVWVDNKPYGVHPSGYITVPVHPGVNTATVKGRSVDLYVGGPPAQTIDAADQPTLDAAIQSMPDGGVIRLTGPGPYRFERWQEVGNGDDWIRIEGLGQTVVGEDLISLRFSISNICWVNVRFDTNSIGSFSPDPGDSIGFIGCVFDGKLGDRWARASNNLGEGQKYYFKSCAVIGDTSYGFTDAQVVDRCVIERCNGDAFQHSYAVTRSLVVEFFEDYVPGAPVHHKDNWQYFADAENIVISDVKIGPAVSTQALFWEDDFHINTGVPDPRTGELRDHYEWSSVTIRRVQAPRILITDDPVITWKSQSQFWGMFRDLWIEDVVIDQVLNFRGGDEYSNRFQLLGTGDINGLICTHVAFNETTGSTAGTTEIPPGFTHQRVGIANPESFGTGFFDIYEPAPYYQAQVALGIAPPLSPNAITPGPMLLYLSEFDLTSQNAPVDDPAYGRPDCIISGADLSFYINAFVAGDPLADFTTTGASQTEPLFGVPDGQVTGADVFFYIAYFINNPNAACP